MAQARFVCKRYGHTGRTNACYKAIDANQGFTFMRIIGQRPIPSGTPAMKGLGAASQYIEEQY